MRKIRWFISILGVIVLLAAMIQNAEPTTLKLFAFETRLPTSILLLATSVTSFLIGGLVVGRLMRISDGGKVVSEPSRPLSEPPIANSPIHPPTTTQPGP